MGPSTNLAQNMITTNLFVVQMKFKFYNPVLISLSVLSIFQVEGLVESLTFFLGRER